MSLLPLVILMLDMFIIIFILINSHASGFVFLIIIIHEGATPSILNSLELIISVVKPARQTRFMVIAFQHL